MTDILFEAFVRKTPKLGDKCVACDGTWRHAEAAPHFAGVPGLVMTHRTVRTANPGIGTCAYLAWHNTRLMSNA